MGKCIDCKKKTEYMRCSACAKEKNRERSMEHRKQYMKDYRRRLRENQAKAEDRKKNICKDLLKRCGIDFNVKEFVNSIK